MQLNKWDRVNAVHERIYQAVFNFSFKLSVYIKSYYVSYMLNYLVEQTTFMMFRCRNETQKNNWRKFQSRVAADSVEMHVLYIL